MNPYIIFNGESSSDRGCIIEQLPDEMRPRRNFEELQIPGRDGRPSIDLGTYDIFQTSLKINCNGHMPTEIYAWLQGEGWLTTSDGPEYMRWVSFYDQIGDSRFRTADACYDTLSIPVRMQPYKYKAAAGVEYLDFTAAATFNGEGNKEALPRLEIAGSGDINLMINDVTVLIDGLDGTIHLDCDAETAYTEMDGVRAFAGRQVSVIGDNWPRLAPGTNAISWTGDIRNVRVRPWWRWI